MRELSVWMNGQRVGVYRCPAEDQEHFEYHPDWLENGYRISMNVPLETGTIPKSRIGPVFENILPDREEHRRKIAYYYDLKGISTFDLLSAIGQDCVGSFQFLDIDEAPEKPWEIDAKPLSDDELTDLISKLEDFPLGVGQQTEPRKSIAGQQNKTSLLKFPGKDTWYDPIGATPSTHIFKPQYDRKNFFDLDENEYFTMGYADRMGLEVPEIDLKYFGEDDEYSCLVIERFDRKWINRDDREGLERIHQEDFCQALGRKRGERRPRNYDDGDILEACFELVKQTNNPRVQQMKILHHYLFQFITGAEDGHLKNYSLFLGDQTKRELTPFYDISSVEPYNLDNPKSLNENPNPDPSVDTINMEPRLCLPIPRSRERDTREIGLGDFLGFSEFTVLTKDDITTMITQYVETAEDRLEETIRDLDSVVPDYVYEPIQYAVSLRINRLKRSLGEHLEH